MMDVIFFGGIIMKEAWFGFVLIWCFVAAAPIAWFLANLTERDHMILPLIFWSFLGIIFSMGGIRAFYEFSWWEAILGFTCYIGIGMYLSKVFWTRKVIQLRNKFLVILNEVQMNNNLDIDYFKNNNNKTDNRYHSRFVTLRDRVERTMGISFQYDTNSWEGIIKDIVPNLKSHRMILTFIVLWWPIAVTLYLVTDGAVATWRAIMNWFDNFYSSSSKKYLGDSLKGE